jgi:molybdopterin/thiamine biosynthesis adenylyltransferase/rhodanese-related sulfurtransferase
MSGSFAQLLTQVKSRIREADPPAIWDMVEAGASTIIDVRELDEFRQGAIEGALHIPRGLLEPRIEGAVPDHERSLIVYCAAGTRSALAVDSLCQLGYANVVSLRGGFAAWREAGLPYAEPAVLTESQRARYSRHLLLPEVGEAGQLKLLAARVLLVGAGGLGSPAALYLAAAGVGTIGLVDGDVVEVSNLQRQVLHATSRLGQAKTASGRQALADLNPGVKVIEHPVRLVAENVLEILGEYDVVIDGADNFATRYLLNDACVLGRKPLVHGSVFRFEGQVTVFDPDRGPCYRCLFPQPPPPEMAPSCAEAGVLGVLPGIVGCLQAMEAMKLVLGIGDTLVGRLLLINALESSFHEVRLQRDPACPACGKDAALERVTDLPYACATPA